MRLLSCCCAALLTFLLLTIGACSKSPPDWQLGILNPSTDVSRPLSANAASGKRIFINYWAEWCKPCITEMPELNRFARAHTDKAIVLGYNFDNKQGDELLKAMQTVAMEFPATVTNPASVFALPEISGLPTTLVLDEQGRLITALMGPQTTATLEQALLIP